jgi:hypothetical protein
MAGKKTEEKGHTHARYGAESTACIEIIESRFAERLNKISYGVDRDKAKARVQARKTEILKEPHTDRLSKITCEDCQRFAKQHPQFWMTLRNTDVAEAAKTGEQLPTMGELKLKEARELVEIGVRRRAAKLGADGRAVDKRLGLPAKGKKGKRAA